MMFVEQLGERANLHGVTVSIISLIGAECRLDALTVVTEITRGAVERVAATQLQKEFSALVDKPVVAVGALGTRLMCMEDVLMLTGWFCSSRLPQFDAPLSKRVCR